MVVRVTVWGENIRDRTDERVRSIYPHGIHGCIRDAVTVDDRITASAATLDQADHGLGADVVAGTDVLVWWAHVAHDQVRDDVVDRVHAAVLEGMGLIVLHSAHASKIFTRLMGTSCALAWRDAGERQRMWVCAPGHPIAQGIGAEIVIPREETYAEPFGIPTPDDVIFISWAAGGDVFRSGITFTRGAGRIVYFAPGHETYPTFHLPQIQAVLRNAVLWAAGGGSWRDASLVTHRAVAPEATETDSAPSAAP